MGVVTPDGGGAVGFDGGGGNVDGTFGGIVEHFFSTFRRNGSEAGHTLKFYIVFEGVNTDGFYS